MSPHLDVLLAGCYTLDLIFTGLPDMPRLGSELFASGFDILPGGAFNTAYALNRLGIRIGWACDFGIDFASQFVLQAASEAGIDQSFFRIHEDSRRFVTAALSFPHDRAFVSYVEGYERAIPIDDVERSRPRWLMLPHLYHGPQALEALAAAHRGGSRVFMDCQSVEVTLQGPGVADALSAVDAFAPNEPEALKLTGADTVESALDQLAGITPLVVIKRGPRGAMAKEGGKTSQQPALAVEVVDTTAAGDCFNAGFLYGALKGMPLDTCLRIGNACGALATTKRGCLGAPTPEQLAELVKVG